MNRWIQYLVRLWKSATKSIAQKNIEERPIMSPADFYSAFYADSGIAPDILAELQDLVASELCVTAGQLRPTDRFAVELTPGRWNEWDSGFAALMTHLGAMARERGTRIEQPIETVDEYIRTMATVYPAP